jgi:hypothetical protein
MALKMKLGMTSSPMMTWAIQNLRSQEAPKPDQTLDFRILPKNYLMINLLFHNCKDSSQ